MPGNNFLINPGGSPEGNRGGSGTRFDNQQAPPQKPREAVADRNTEDAAPGGLLPLVPPTGDDVGCGTLGDSNKPYRLNGGG